MSAALPKTYNQLAVFRGTGCSATSRIGAASCKRRSNHSANLSLSKAHGGFVSEKSGACSRSGQFAGLNGDQTVLNFVRILEQPAFRWTRRARAVAVVRSAVARAHEQTGLRKPADRAAEVRAVDGKNLELLAFDAAHPARCVHGLAVGRHHVGISKCGQARLAFGEFADADREAPRTGRRLRVLA